MARIKGKCWAEKETVKCSGALKKKKGQKSIQIEQEAKSGRVEEPFLLYQTFACI